MNRNPGENLMIGLVTPILNNFVGFCDLMRSMTGTFVTPIVLDNWRHPTRCLAASWNEGVTRAFTEGCTHVLVTNDDTLLCYQGAYRLAKRLDESEANNENVILTTARQIHGNPSFDGTLEGMEKMVIPGVNEGDSPDFSCFMINQRTIDKAGWFDENFIPAYFEDNDYHRRIHLAGYICANIGSVVHDHIGSQTVKNAVKNPIVTGKMFDANRHYYVQKWGGIPGQEKFLTPFNANHSIKDWFPEDRQGY